MIDQYKQLTDMLGYDTNKKGFALFVNVAEEVRDLLKQEMSHDDIMAVLPSLFLEEYHFFLDMSKTRYMELLEDFVNSRKVTRKNASLNACFKLQKENLPLNGALVFFAEYFNYIENINEHTKQMIRKYSDEKK